MEYIPLSVPNMGAEERKLVDEAVDASWVSTGGPFVKEFEKVIADYVGTPDAVACGSGTAALHLTMMEAGVSRDDLVIAPDLTFFATVNPIRYCGADPVFMDCDDTLCMDPEKLEDYCSKECELRGDELYEKASGRRVRAVVPVHVFGNLADMESINDIAEKYHLKVVEDAAESLGSRWTKGRYAGKHSGTVGDFGAFSFNGNKIVTTGGGGMCVSKEQKGADHMRHISTQAKVDTLRFIHDEVGYNYRLTNLQSALGIGQMSKMDEFIETKKRNYELYQELGIELMQFSPNCAPNYWFYAYLAGDKRDLLIEELDKRGIGSRPIWELMHRLKPYRDSRAYRIEKAPLYHASVVNIPCSTNLTEDEVRYVASQIKDIMG